VQLPKGRESKVEKCSLVKSKTGSPAQARVALPKSIVQLGSTRLRYRPTRFLPYLNLAGCRLNRQRTPQALNVELFHFSSGCAAVNDSSVRSFSSQVNVVSRGGGGAPAESDPADVNLARFARFAPGASASAIPQSTSKPPQAAANGQAATGSLERAAVPDESSSSWPRSLLRHENGGTLASKEALLRERGRHRQAPRHRRTSSPAETRRREGAAHRQLLGSCHTLCYNSASATQRTLAGARAWGAAAAQVAVAAGQERRVCVRATSARCMSTRARSSGGLHLSARSLSCACGHAALRCARRAHARCSACCTNVSSPMPRACSLRRMRPAPRP